MATDVTNVLIGPGRLYLAPIGTTPPLETTETLTWGTGWNEVGYTEDGVEFQYTPKFTDHMVDQELGAVKTTLDAEELVVNVKLAETDLRNLSRGISASNLSAVSAGVGQPGQDILTIGSATVVERMIGFEGKSPEGFYRMILVWRVISVGAVGHSYKKGEKTLIPVQFKALVDQTKAAGQKLARIVDKTAVGS